MSRYTYPKRNREGYSDMTAYLAIRKVDMEQQRKLNKPRKRDSKSTNKPVTTRSNC